MKHIDVAIFFLAAVLIGIAVFWFAPAEPGQAYRRADWGGFIDEDKNCRNTRQEVLIRDSRKPVIFRDARQCEVAWGEWEDPYMGAIINDPEQLDADHVIALREAYDSGGAGWPRAKKRAYANFLEYRFHLIAVSASANRAKGAKGPEAWRPRKEFQCQYAHIRGAIKSAWGLRTGPAEQAAMRVMLATC